VAFAGRWLIASQSAFVVERPITINVLLYFTIVVAQKFFQMKKALYVNAPGAIAP
jgi:hypothetical protein